MNGVLDALLGGLKTVGQAGLDVGETVAKLPINVLTAIPAFAKDPEVFLHGGREGALAALLSPDYRKQMKTQLDASREFDKMRQHKFALDFADSILGTTPQSGQYGAVQQLSQAGVTDPEIENALANQQQRQMAQQVGATELGLPDSVSSFVKPEQLPRLFLQRQQARAVADRAAGAAERTIRRLTLAEKREARLASQPARATPEEARQRRLTERGANVVFDRTAAQTGDAAAQLAGTITDPGMRASVVTQIPTFSARQAKRAAEDFAGRPTTLKSLGLRKRLREQTSSLIKGGMDPQEAAFTAAAHSGDAATTLAAAVPQEGEARIEAASKKFKAALSTGMPPAHASAVLVKAGYTPEEVTAAVIAATPEEDAINP
jgi:SOS response regulatory protein OraA/RecX